VAIIIAILSYLLVLGVSTPNMLGI
jgi:hypothetical protein